MDWKFFVGLVGSVSAFCWSVFVWAKSQSQQRAQEEFTRKEKLYRELLVSVSAFYKGNTAVSSKAFLEQVRLAWLYAPDDVIAKLYRFTSTQKADLAATTQDLEGARMLAELVAAIRLDLFRTIKKQSRLTAADFQHLSALDPPRPPTGTFGTFGLLKGK